MNPSFGFFDDPWHHHLSPYSEFQRRKQAEAEVARRERIRKAEEEERMMAEYNNNNNNNMSRLSTNHQRHSKKVQRKGKPNFFATAAPTSSSLMVGEVEDEKVRIVRGLDGKYYKVGSINPSSSSNNENETMKNKLNDVTMNTVHDEYSYNASTDSANDGEDDDHHQNNLFDIGSQKTGRQIETMIKQTVSSHEVEDVSDEEDEELQELRSVWRNRLPSPGQWIEPVDAICW
jgi:hypothetical protein